jgi:hypothetical protein
MEKDFKSMTISEISEFIRQKLKNFNPRMWQQRHFVLVV